MSYDKFVRCPYGPFCSSRQYPIGICSMTTNIGGCMSPSPRMESSNLGTESHTFQAHVSSLLCRGPVHMTAFRSIADGTNRRFHFFDSNAKRQSTATTRTILLYFMFGPLQMVMIRLLNGNSFLIAYLE